MQLKRSFSSYRDYDSMIQEDYFDDKIQNWFDGRAAVISDMKLPVAAMRDSTCRGEGLDCM